MNDAQTRHLERQAAQGDEEARIALGAQRVREGRCPACGGEGMDDEPDRFCPPCFWIGPEFWNPPGCSAKQINDGQSKEDV
tara:strand:- start:28434 stop:28676 length:243 start_codon:yes stop_codon:yes gene_type:complete